MSPSGHWRSVNQQGICGTSPHHFSSPECFVLTFWLLRVMGSLAISACHVWNQCANVNNKAILLQIRLSLGFLYLNVLVGMMISLVILDCSLKAFNVDNLFRVNWMRLCFISTFGLLRAMVSSYWSQCYFWS